MLQQKEARNSLREKLQNQLKAAEFRFLNEKLYRADKSDDILDDASAKIYHEGFSRQVQRWPVNPVTVLIKHVRKRVPRKHVIADLGCGDAKIAAAVQNTVHSFDLIKHNERLVIGPTKTVHSSLWSMMSDRSIRSFVRNLHGVLHFSSNATL